MTDKEKAIEAVANATGKAIDSVQHLGGFVAKYIHGPLDQAMGIVIDKLMYQRWERRIRLMIRADAFLAERGFDAPTRAVPMNLFIPLVQNGSMEENDDLQDRWAALLANAADESAKIEVRRAFVSILEDLTALDAFVLEKLYENSLGAASESDFYQELWTTFLPDRLVTTKPTLENLNPPRDIMLALGNLARLGLATTAMNWSGIAIFSCVNRTILGREFMVACRRRRIA